MNIAVLDMTQKETVCMLKLDWSAKSSDWGHSKMLLQSIKTKTEHCDSECMNVLMCVCRGIPSTSEILRLKEKYISPQSEAWSVATSKLSSQGWRWFWDLKSFCYVTQSVFYTMRAPSLKNQKKMTQKNTHYIFVPIRARKCVPCHRKMWRETDWQEEFSPFALNK